jgi:alkanesulfonate monooxygenase SsuD/methylene tetrahydromethanopterin reductase-like flavin-dependent oxidoreductase (luciferase family)
MHFGLYTPCYGEYADPRRMSDLARQAEAAGWDGLFISDHLQWLSPAPQPVGDPWILLAAMAMSTQRIRIGALVTPLARRRPWKLAREAVTLDHLSGGRMILGAGIGGDWLGEYSAFGESADDRLHAEQLDEGLQVVVGLWSGAPFGFQGTHYQIRDVQFLPPPVQQPRIPIWVAAGWPRERPMRRAAQWDGVVPFKPGGLLVPDDCRDMLAKVQQYRSAEETFDLACYESTVTEGDEVDADMIGQFAEAGVTWWLRGLDFNLSIPFARMLERVQQGPPRIPRSGLQVGRRS